MDDYSERHFSIEDASTPPHDVRQISLVANTLQERLDADKEAAVNGNLALEKNENKADACVYAEVARVVDFIHRCQRDLSFEALVRSNMATRDILEKTNENKCRIYVFFLQAKTNGKSKKLKLDGRWKVLLRAIRDVVKNTKYGDDYISFIKNRRHDNSRQTPIHKGLKACTYWDTKAHPIKKKPLEPVDNDILYNVRKFNDPLEYDLNGFALALVHKGEDGQMIAIASVNDQLTKVINQVFKKSVERNKQPSSVNN